MDVPVQRIVFEGSKIAQVVPVKNDTDTMQIYLVGWQHYAMNENTGLENIPREETVRGVNWADNLVTFEPRRFALPPGGVQQLKLALDPPPRIGPGEYRSHLWIRTATPPPDDGQTKAARVPIQTAVAIPLIVRYGNMAAEAKITGLALNGAELRLMLERTGNMSLFGDLTFTCTGGKKEHLLKTAGGIAVYTEVARRRLSYTLAIPDNMKDACRSLRADYTARPDDVVFHGKVMASAETGASAPH